MDNLQDTLSRLISIFNPTSPNFPYVLRVAQCTAVAGSLYLANKALNILALNHWFVRRQGVPWDFLSGKEVAVVTGGSSGFGHLIVKGLAPRMKVAVIDVQDMPEDLKALSTVRFYKCDITSASSVSSTASAIRTDLGTPSILINNAGIAHAHTILNTSEEYLEKVFRVNLFSHFTLIKEFLPAMLEQKKGHILAIASMASYAVGSGLVDYSATKAAVLALHEGLNSELRSRYPNGNTIQTSIVHPMYARTPLISSFESALDTMKTPVLTAADVADSVVAQVLGGTSGQIYVPKNMSFLSGLRGWPHWMQELMRDGLSNNTPA